jgi:hypothetical protein
MEVPIRDSIRRPVAEHRIDDPPANLVDREDRTDVLAWRVGVVRRFDIVSTIGAAGRRRSP